MSFIFQESLLNVLFFWAMFMTRNVKDEFKMVNELRTMTFTRFLVDLCFLFPVVFFPKSAFTVFGCAQYFQIAMCLFLCFDSAFRQIVRTFKAN